MGNNRDRDLRRFRRRLNRADNWRIPVAVLVLCSLMGVMIAVQFAIRERTTTVDTCTISAVLPGKDGVHSVWSSCALMSIAPDYVGGQWWSFDRANQLEVGKTYKLTNAGIFPKNIIKIEPIAQP